MRLNRVNQWALYENEMDHLIISLFSIDISREFYSQHMSFGLIVAIAGHGVCISWFRKHKNT